MRRLLYMATLAAIRHNPDLDRKYRELVGRGKPPKVALTAVMRKLLLLANALLRHNRLWTPRANKPHAQLADNASGPWGLGEQRPRGQPEPPPPLPQASNPRAATLLLSQPDPTEPGSDQPAEGYAPTEPNQHLQHGYLSRWT